MVGAGVLKIGNEIPEGSGLIVVADGRHDDGLLLFNKIDLD